MEENIIIIRFKSYFRIPSLIVILILIGMLLVAQENFFGALLLFFIPIKYLESIFIYTIKIDLHKRTVSFQKTLGSVVLSANEIDHWGLRTYRILSRGGPSYAKYFECTTKQGKFFRYSLQEIKNALTLDTNSIVGLFEKVFQSKPKEYSHVGYSRFPDTLNFKLYKYIFSFFFL